MSNLLLWARPPTSPPQAVLARAAANTVWAELKGLWDRLVEHGPAAASLISNDAAQFLDSVIAIVSLGTTLLVSASYAGWALVQLLKSRKAAKREEAQ